VSTNHEQTQMTRIIPIENIIKYWELGKVEKLLFYTNINKDMIRLVEKDKVEYETGGNKKISGFTVQKGMINSI